MKDFFEFTGFPKIARWRRDVVITEKIDGTNAQIVIAQIADEDYEREAGPFVEQVDKGEATAVEMEQNGKVVHRFLRAASRSRFIRPGADNFAFAKWVFENAAELAQLGPGKHFGEWWGSGIQRGYGQPAGVRHFSLFNVHRYRDARPACCSIVPILYEGPMVMPGGEAADDWCMRRLKYAGSETEQARGFKDPEGLAIYHTAANILFKYTTGPEEQRGKERAA